MNTKLLYCQVAIFVALDGMMTIFHPYKQIITIMYMIIEECDIIQFIFIDDHVQFESYNTSSLNLKISLYVLLMAELTAQKQLEHTN